MSCRRDSCDKWTWVKTDAAANGQWMVSAKTALCERTPAHLLTNYILYVWVGVGRVHNVLLRGRKVVLRTGGGWATLSSFLGDALERAHETAVLQVSTEI